jgi:hypothetical protein
MSEETNYTTTDMFVDSMNLNNTYDAFRGFKGLTIRVVSLWKPIGKYYFDSSSVDKNNPLPVVTPKLVARMGLDITLKNSNGSFFQIRVPCTDALWDNILENQIYKYKDDIIYLKFDQDGVAYDYSLNVNPEVPNEDYDEGYVPSVPRAKTLIDKLNKQKTAIKGSEAGIPATPLADTIGNMVIYMVNKDKQEVSVFRAAETVSAEKIQETQNILQDMVGKNQAIEKLDVLDNASLIVDIRKDGKLIYVDFGK